MQPSTSFDWERAVTPARWVAGILGGVPFVGWAWLQIAQAFGSEAYPYADRWVILGVIGAGLVIALFWRGIGEVVGGLALVGAAVWMGFNGGFEFLAIVAALPFALAGVLFVACGWYTLAQRSRRATHGTI